MDVENIFDSMDELWELIKNIKEDPKIVDLLKYCIKIKNKKYNLFEFVDLICSKDRNFLKILVFNNFLSSYSIQGTNTTTIPRKIAYQCWHILCIFYPEEFTANTNSEKGTDSLETYMLQDVSRFFKNIEINYDLYEND